MPLSCVYQKLEVLKKERSSNEKIKLLKDFLQDPVFDAVVQMALSHDKTYHVKSFGKYDPDSPGGSYKEIMQFLLQLNDQEGTTKYQKEELRRLASSNPETFQVVERTVQKDLRCGVHASLVNKAVPGTVLVIPYMRCQTEKQGLKNISYSTGAFCQKKADGGFCYAFCDWETGEPVMMSRNGKYLNMHGIFDDDIRLLKKADEVLTMELTAVDGQGKDMPRKYGNGLVTKAIRGTITLEEALMFRGQAWDVIPQKDFWKEIYKVGYEQRWRRVSRITRSMKRISRIRSKRVYSEAEAREFFLDMRRQGFEGAVLKNTEGIWKSHTSPDQVKLKKKHCAEFVITGWYCGDVGKKYEKCLGGLRFESRDGVVKCNTGSGFTDADRGFLGFDEDNNPIVDEKVVKGLDELIGQIVSIEFDSLIQDKSKAEGTWSLFLPIFDKLRPDKIEADNFDYLNNL